MKSLFVTLSIIFLIQIQVRSQNIKPSALPFEVFSQTEMKKWAVDKRHDGQKLWAETTWGSGDTTERFLWNWNTWPCRIVLNVDENAEVVKTQAIWRRSGLSIRMTGLKLIKSSSKKEIKDARIIEYSQEKIVIEFKPEGKGIYYLYYGANEPPLFSPSEQWLAMVKNSKNPSYATAEKIEVRSAADNFSPMEVVALPRETAYMQKQYAKEAYLVFPEDRNNSIKLNLEIPYHWLQKKPNANFTITADRNEYRVFQLGIWALNLQLDDVDIVFSDLVSEDGKNRIPSEKLQCLTLYSKIKSLYIKKPDEIYPIPKGQVRALWCGIDIPDKQPSGSYSGTINIIVPGQKLKKMPVHLVVKDSRVDDKGDNELWRLSHLRWIESNIGINDSVYKPFKPLVVSDNKKEITTWGQTYSFTDGGFPKDILINKQQVMSAPPTITCKLDGKEILWQNDGFQITEATEGHVSWTGKANYQSIKLIIKGRLDFDGCAMINAELQSDRKINITDLKLQMGWKKEYAQLASGIGYHGLRDGNRIWSKKPNASSSFEPAVWIGTIDAGLTFITWLKNKSTSTTFGKEGNTKDRREEEAWADVQRNDAMTVFENDKDVTLTLNFGNHELSRENQWAFSFALLPTPVKPIDTQHWQYRFYHASGDFYPHDYNTPHGFIANNFSLLDKVQDIGTKRLNMHDWWGPIFNYPIQYDRPDNLSVLSKEVHRRNMFIKVYNSGRELSNLTPEFWAVAYEAGNYPYSNQYEQNPKKDMKFQDAWIENHWTDAFPRGGWPREHENGNIEHCLAVSNSTRWGNFYLEGLNYMTKHYGVDGAYWDGADGPQPGHREMAMRLWKIFRKTNPNATIDSHHGDDVLSSPVTGSILCWSYIDVLWHGEGFNYKDSDPYRWLVEIACIPFGVSAEMLGGDEYIGRGMLFGIWSRAGWFKTFEKQKKLWNFFDTFNIEHAQMLGWWEKYNGVTIDVPQTLCTVYKHNTNGIFIVIGSWHDEPAAWQQTNVEVTFLLDHKFLGIPEDNLQCTDILTGENFDIKQPVPLPKIKEGRMLWIRKK